MSYDISFKVKVENVNHWIDIGDCDANITWNVGEMIRKSTGLEWNNTENNGFCKDIIPHIVEGLRQLENKPEFYKKYESPNGWGTIEGCKNFFRRIIKCWDTFCKKNYSIMDKEEADKLINVTTFWIE